jgi:CrcB protein
MNTVWLAAVVAVGAAIGGVLRWLIGLAVNPWWSGFPLGTLAVNAVGGLLVGMAYVWFGKPTAVDAQASQEAWRLLLVTGFLGGLTTFSTFSVELLALLEKNRFPLALGHVLSHVLGALCCAYLGTRLMRLWL